MNIRIVDFTHAMVPQAKEIAKKELQKEWEIHKEIPLVDEGKRLEGLLYWLCDQKYKKAAFIDDKLIGYMLFIGPFDDFLGFSKGVFSPLGGNGFLEESETGIAREKVVSILYEKLAALLVKEGVTTHAICRYANDYSVGQSLVFNGFGIRCQDAVINLDHMERLENLNADEEVEYLEIERSKAYLIEDLSMRLVHHLASSPIFMPTDLNAFDPRYEGKEGLRIFIAKKGDKVIGYINIVVGGENFLIKNPETENICGTYFLEEYRTKGMAAGLLRFMCNTLKREGKKYVGVDYESINPTALHFWPKYFTPYTSSYVRCNGDGSSVMQHN